MNQPSVRPRILRNMLAEAGIQCEKLTDNHYVVNGGNAGTYDFFPETCSWVDRSEPDATFKGVRKLIETIRELSDAVSS